MIVNSNISRDIIETEQLSFDSSIIKDNTTGLFSLGFSGGNPWQITLQSGVVKIDNNKIYSYNSNELINISGQIGAISYDLFINDQPIVLGAPRTTGNFNKVFANCNNCSTNLDLFLTTPPFSLTYTDQTFYLSGQSGLQGTISSNKRFTILSGTPPNLDEPFSFSGFTTGLSTQHTFFINKTLDDYIDYEMPISLYTSLGQVDFIFSITGIPPTQNYFSTSFSPSDFSLENSTKTYIYQILSSSGYDLKISLDHVSGRNFHYESVFSTGSFGGSITGQITGSGFLTRQVFVTGSGINSENQLVSGSFTGHFSSILSYATGLQTGSFTVSGSGLGTGIGYSGISTGYFNYRPIYTIDPGSGTYIFDNSSVTGAAISPVYRINTTTTVIATSPFSGFFMGTGTGSGTYISSSLLSGGLSSGLMTGLVLTSGVTGSWRFETGINQYNMFSYYPNYIIGRSYSKPMSTFPSNLTSINMKITHLNGGYDLLDISKLIISGSDYREYLLTGTN